MLSITITSYLEKRPKSQTLQCHCKIIGQPSVWKIIKVFTRTDKNHNVTLLSVPTYIFMFTRDTRPPVPQLVEHRAVTQEVMSLTPAGPPLRVLK